MSKQVDERVLTEAVMAGFRRAAMEPQPALPFIVSELCEALDISVSPMTVGAIGRAERAAAGL